MAVANVYGSRIGANVEVRWARESTKAHLIIDDPKGVQLGPDEINRLIHALRTARDQIKTPDQ